MPLLDRVESADTCTRPRRECGYGHYFPRECRYGRKRPRNRLLAAESALLRKITSESALSERLGARIGSQGMSFAARSKQSPPCFWHLTTRDTGSAPAPLIRAAQTSPAAPSSHREPQVRRQPRARAPHAGQCRGRDALAPRASLALAASDLQSLAHVR